MFRYWFQIDLFHQTQMFPLHMTSSAHIPSHSDPSGFRVLDQLTKCVLGPIVDVNNTAFVSAILASGVLQIELSSDVDGSNETDCVSNGQKVSENC